MDKKVVFLNGQKAILNLPQNKLLLKISGQGFEKFELEKYSGKSFAVARLGRKDSGKFVRWALFFKKGNDWVASLPNVPYGNYEISFMQEKDQIEKVIFKKNVNISKRNINKLNSKQIEVDLDR